MIFLKTPRLILRQWKEEDKFPFASLNSNDEVMKFFPSHLSSDQSDEFIERSKHYILEHGHGLFAVELKDTGEFIGFIGLNRPNFDAGFMPALEIGWRLDNKFWGKGYATEGAMEALRFGIKDLKETIVSFTSIHNILSTKVMQRIGMVTDPKENFKHPRVAQGDRLSEHVLYRMP